MREWWSSLRLTHFSVDPRSLGVFRVLFGLVLLSDLARRWVELDFWYTNSGLLPNHTVLWRPPAERMFSLFFGVSRAGEAHVGFALCAIVYVLFTLGYRTRLLQLLTLVARVSLNTRLAVLENGGDMVMDLLCLLTLPLPLGTRFSLDAVRAVDSAPSDAPDWRTRPIVSIAVLGLLLQFATIYYFNAAAKNGVAWRDGTAVHYALHQDRLVTWIGVWLREHLSIPVLRVLTWSVLVTEWLGFVLIITPIATQQARLLAICLMPLLHLGFALGLNLGGFSPAMMAFYPLLLTREHWDGLEKRFGAKAQPLRLKIEALATRMVKPQAAVPAVAADPRWRWLSEAAVVLVLLAITTEVLNDNTPVPKALRVSQPAWARAIIDYPRILQGWRMFASEPSRGDTMIYVDATTASGAHVDPYNEVASDQRYPKGDVVPTHMGQSQFFVMYSERIANASYSAYRQAFSEWIEAYPKRTGREEDCLLRYEVYFVADQSPPPGAGSAPPKPSERQRFMSYTAPSDSPCRALRKPIAPARPATSVAVGND
jgi:hypothetical protein